MKRPPRVDPTIYFLKRRKLTDIQAAPTGGQNEWDDDSPSYETNFPNIKVRRVYGMEQIIIMKGESNRQYLGRTRKKIILIQVHGGHGKLVSIARLYSTVASKAGDNNKHVFALTLLREPTHFKIWRVNGTKIKAQNSESSKPRSVASSRPTRTVSEPRRECKHLTVVFFSNWTR